MIFFIMINNSPQNMNKHVKGWRKFSKQSPEVKVRDCRNMWSMKAGECEQRLKMVYLSIYRCRALLDLEGNCNLICSWGLIWSARIYREVTVSINTLLLRIDLCRDINSRFVDMNIICRGYYVLICRTGYRQPFGSDLPFICVFNMWP